MRIAPRRNLLSVNALARTRSGVAESSADRGVSFNVGASVCTPVFTNDASLSDDSIACNASSLTEFDDFFNQSDRSSNQLRPNGLALNPRTSNERNPKARPDVPSESVTFCDKLRRLLSTPLFTGYYVSDRPPDGQAHNYGMR